MTIVCSRCGGDHTRSECLMTDYSTGVRLLTIEHAKSVGWNAAIKAAADIVEKTGLQNPQNIAREIRKLDRSIQATAV